MTIEKAKKLICPFITRANPHPKSVVANTTCITTGCMAWIKTKTHYCLDDLTDEEKEQHTPPNRYFNMPEEKYEGYCSRLGVRDET